MKIYALATKNKDGDTFEFSINFIKGISKTCFLNKENAEEIRKDISTSEYPLKIVEFNVGDCLSCSDELKDIASKAKWRS